MNKCSESLGSDHFSVHSPCNSFIKNYTKVFYIINKRDVPSFQCKMSFDQSMSMREVHGLSVVFIDF